MEITGDNLRNLWRKSFLSRLFAILYSAMHWFVSWFLLVCRCQSCRYGWYGCRRITHKLLCFSCSSAKWHPKLSKDHRRHKYRSFRDHSLSGILPPYYIVSCQIWDLTVRAVTLPYEDSHGCSLSSDTFWKVWCHIRNTPVLWPLAH